MHKRGQVFLIAVIILILALFSVVVSYNSIKTYYGLDDFKRLSENYQAEYPKVYNYAVYTGVNVSEAVENFSSLFLQQARETDPNFIYCIVVDFRIFCLIIFT